MKNVKVEKIDNHYKQRSNHPYRLRIEISEEFLSNSPTRNNTLWIQASKLDQHVLWSILKFNIQQMLNKC